MKLFQTLGALVLLLATCPGFAQSNPALVTLAKPQPDGVWLRWAPSTPAYWQLGNKHGYTLERFTLRPDGEMEPSSQTTLGPSPLKPLAAAELEKIAASSDEVAVLQELLYGQNFKPVVSGQDLSAVLAKNQELENRYGMALLMCDLSLEAAKAGALFWKDTSAEKGKRYIYRISIATSAVTMAPGVVLVKVEEPKPMLEILDLKAQFGNRKVTLSWSTLMHKGLYSAYYLEKSTDGKNFTPLSDLPYVHMSEKLTTETAFYVDSLTTNQTPFYYRIRGISPFAEKGPYSNSVSGEGKDDLTGLLVIREAKVGAKRQVRVVWEFPASIEKQIAGFVVSSAGHPNGPYTDRHKKTLAKNLREFTQETPYNNTYYTLRAVDKNGKELARSFPYLAQIADETPPAIPIGLSGSMDKTGVASLTWTANTDKDLLGYRVFRSNSLGEEFVEVTKLILATPSFVDTVNIRVLNKKVFYSLVAVDKNYNPSDYSSPLLLNRPDILAPTAPVLTRTEVIRDTIALAWVNSVSEDVARYELSRIEKAEKLTRRVMMWYPSAPITRFEDKSLTAGQTYQYRITAYDSAGNSSETTSREIFFEPGYRPAATDLKDSVDREAKKILLRWKNGQPASKCLVYRQTNEGPLKILVTLEGNAESFTDTMVSANNTYIYKIQPVFDKGVRALISKGQKVVY